MKQIKDINCICTTMNQGSKNRYVGKVALDKKGFFEGILVDLSTRRNYLAFGYYKEGIILNIVKGICDDRSEYPKEIRLRKSDKSYKGEISIKSSFADFPIGKGEVQVLEINRTRREQKEELDNLNRRVMILKSNMNKETKEVYQKVMPKQEVEKRKIFTYL